MRSTNNKYIFKPLNQFYDNAYNFS